MKIKTYLSVIFLIVILPISILVGQNIPSIQTDRPDQTECPFIVPKNHIQIETGFSYEKIDLKNSSIAYPSVLIKFGLNDRFELRLVSELVSEKNEDIIISGFLPVAIGCKIQFIQEDGLFPTTSLIGHLSIPNIASDKFRATYYAPSFRFTMQHTLSEDIALGYNLGAEWNGESPEPVFIYTLTTGFSLSEALGCYLEVYGYAPQEKIADHRLDGGLTYLLQQNVMIDLSGGLGITSNAPDYFCALGFSFRLMD